MSNLHTDGKLTKLGTAFLQDMVGIGAAIVASSAQIPTEQAEQVAYELVAAMTKHWGGSMLYVPKTDPNKVIKRNRAMWNDFTGDNHHQLAQNYDLATPTVYQILADFQKSLPKSQEDLFDSE